MPIRNVCHCDQPPGGGGDCDPSQLAICRASGSSCIHECHSPPASLQAAERRVWCLDKVLGGKSLQSAGLTRHQAAFVLRSGRYVDLDAGTTVTFTLPKPRRVRRFKTLR